MFKEEENKFVFANMLFLGCRLQQKDYSGPIIHRASYTTLTVRNLDFSKFGKSPDLVNRKPSLRSTLPCDYESNFSLPPVKHGTVIYNYPPQGSIDTPLSSASRKLTNTQNNS